MVWTPVDMRVGRNGGMWTHVVSCGPCGWAANHVLGCGWAAIVWTPVDSTTCGWAAN